jgi:hypothetical protein
VVPVLPPAYTTVWASGVPYYYANDTYYAATAGEYAVVPEGWRTVPATPPH